MLVEKTGGTTPATTACSVDTAMNVEEIATVLTAGSDPCSFDLSVAAGESLTDQIATCTRNADKDL